MGSRTYGTPRAHTSAIALGAALTIHSAAAIALLRVDPNWHRTTDTPVEIDVNEPPPAAPPAPAPEPPREPVQAKIIPRRLAMREPPRSVPPSDAPPPPNQEPPPNAIPNAPPVFGVTMSSVVSGEAAMAVPVGNTTMTKVRSRPTSSAPSPYPAEGTRPFVPVPEAYVSKFPHVLHEVNSDDVYPPEAKALGLEGIVKLRVGLDQDGNVVVVRILPPRAGHGFDEAAAAAMKRFLFSPARNTEGRVVPFNLTYQFTFSMKN